MVKAAQLPILLLCFLHSICCLDSVPPTIQYKVLEEVPTGTLIGKIADDLRLEGENEALEDFRIVEPVRALPFQVGLQDGTLSIADRLDRDALCWDASPCLITFNILYRKGGAIELLQLQVEVLDINDHNPTFPSLEQEIEISESASLHTTIPLDRALDPDAGTNALHTYSLSPNQHFQLDVITRPEGTKHGQLVVIKALDREVQSSCEMLLTACDKGNPPKCGTMLVRVNVLDSNDNSPVFERSLFSVELKEDTIPGTTIINLQATDPDQGANGEIEYSFSKHVPLEVLSTFNINPKTGTVTLTGVLDYEERHTYELDIQARDLGPNPIPAHCKLHIKVLDVNDNAPKIHVMWAPPDSDVAMVSEGAATETFLALVMVSDADSGLNGNIQCQIHHGLGHFRLRRTHGDNFMVVTNATLDRERQEKYNLTLVAKDQGIPSFSLTKHLTVHVMDENDNAPVFSKSLYEVSFQENNPHGLYILTVKAHDVDLGLSGNITYSIKDSNKLEKPAGSFIIHPTDGMIYAQQSLDFEQTKYLTLIVEATDNGQPPLSSSASVLINLQDVNDNHPLIVDPVLKNHRAALSIPVNTEKREIVSEVEEAASEHRDTLTNYLLELFPKSNDSAAKVKPDGYLVTTVKAKDADAGLNGELRYEIASRDSLFAIDEVTGQIYVNTSNVTELIGKVFLIEVTIRDLGSPPLSTRCSLELTFLSLFDHLKNSSPGQHGLLSFSLTIAICLGAFCLLVVLAATLVTTFCRNEKRENRAYNCRQAESTYTRHPRRPQKQIQKADIHLVPVLRRRQDEPVGEDTGRPPSAGSTLTLDALEAFPPCQFNLSPSLSRTLRNQTFPENNSTLPLSPPRTLRKPHNIEESGTLPRTPANSHRTLKKPKNMEFHQIEGSTAQLQASLPCTGTLMLPGKAAVQHNALEEPDSAPASPLFRTLRRQRNTDSKSRSEKDNHQQILRNLVRISMAALADYNPIELTAASTEQISQLLSLLHRGQFQPKPNFRGNKYSARAGRSGVQDADWQSTKDSGHGESEAGDMDWETGQDSPIDPLLVEELDNLLTQTDDVFMDLPDPAWMARLSLPLTTDYRENVFVPDGPLSLETPALPAAADEAASFSTFGKAPGESSQISGHLLSEVSTLFEMLLTQKADSHPRTSAEVLYRLSAAYRRSLGLEGAATGGGNFPRDTPKTQDKADPSRDMEIHQLV
ncbi:protocadherin-12 isoform X2 [Polyodon spathula]|uniref:protocadherin-12 isoform X2 n=1 Tax=Polyodon spathula TaxID=7913 RepID=UPI001B7DAA1A|nr:protocadherin-12 isoform X2 [Polyodon spathula]